MAGFEVDRIGAKEGPLAARHRDLPGDDDGRVVIIVVPVFFEAKTADQVGDGIVVHIFEAAVLHSRLVMVIARRKQPQAGLDDVSGIERRRSQNGNGQIVVGVPIPAAMEAAINVNFYWKALASLSGGENTRDLFLSRARSKISTSSTVPTKACGSQLVQNGLESPMNRSLVTMVSVKP